MSRQKFSFRSVQLNIHLSVFLQWATSFPGQIGVCSIEARSCLLWDNTKICHLIVFTQEFLSVFLEFLVQNKIMRYCNCISWPLIVPDSITFCVDHEFSKNYHVLAVYGIHVSRAIVGTCSMGWIGYGPLMCQ